MLPQVGRLAQGKIKIIFSQRLSQTMQMEAMHRAHIKMGIKSLEVCRLDNLIIPNLVEGQVSEILCTRALEDQEPDRITISSASHRQADRNH